MDDGASPSPALRGLVEVYPNDAFTLTANIPAMRKITEQRAGSLDVASGTKTRSSTSARSSQFGEEGSSESKSTTSNVAKGTAYSTEERVEIEKGRSVKVSESEGLKGGKVHSGYSQEVSEGVGFGRKRVTGFSDASDEEEIDFTDETVVSQAVVLKRNGVELDITKSINSILDIARNVKSAFDNFKNAVPKIGWQADLELGFLEGSFSAEWGIRPEPKRVHAPIEGSSTPALRGTARASALGYACEASVNAKCGIKFEGKFSVGYDTPPTFEGKLEWLPIIVRARLEHPLAKARDMEVFRWPKHTLSPIWQGKLPPA